MNKLITLVSLVLCHQSFAAKQTGYLCEPNKYNRKLHEISNIRMDLQQIGSSTRFTLTLFEIRPDRPHSPYIIYSAPVATFSEDVHFSGKSADRRASFYMFMDEEGQDGVTLDGKTIRLTCKQK